MPASCWSSQPSAHAWSTVVEPSGTHSFKHCVRSTHEVFFAHAVSTSQQLDSMQLLHASTELVRPQLDNPPLPATAGGAVHGTDVVETQSPAIGGRSFEQPSTDI